MKNGNNLRAAKAAKNDEFYTQMDDICRELKEYKEYFKGKTILCNCDDPYESNFFKYFATFFNSLGLKKLMSTSYSKDGRPAYVTEMTYLKDMNGDTAEDLQDVELILKANPPKQLKGNGSFDSPECIELLKEADIVVSNPPFSLFRDYVDLLTLYDKKFLIVGNKNAISYKNCFRLIKENKMWLGTGFIEKFVVPDGSIKVAPGCWFTNLPNHKRNEFIDCWKSYNPTDYPKYDNYDAINCDKTADIPGDYDGIIGVPITFMFKYNPKQFEIIDMNPHFFMAQENGLPKIKQLTLHNVGKKDPYCRILIRKIK